MPTPSPPQRHPPPKRYKAVQAVQRPCFAVFNRSTPSHKPITTQPKTCHQRTHRGGMRAMDFAVIVVRRLPFAEGTLNRRRSFLASHLVLHGYGHWLSNDPRGSGSESVRKDELKTLGEIHPDANGCSLRGMS